MFNCAGKTILTAVVSAHEKPPELTSSQAILSGEQHKKYQNDIPTRIIIDLNPHNPMS